RCFITAEGATNVPEAATSKVSWEYPDGIPTVVVEWKAGQFVIRETLMCPIHDPVIVRTIALKNIAQKNIDASTTVLLYPNLMFFDEYEVDRARGTLKAGGYRTMRLFSLNESIAGDRHLNVKFGSVPRGATRTITVVLTLDYSREEFEKKGIDRMRQETAKYWNNVASLDSGHQGLDHLFRVSTSGLRTAVAQSGKMDGAIWQYNLEWVRDQSMVAAASAMAGQREIAEALLQRILTRSVDETGKTVEASRHRPAESIELDQNGELLYALYTHWVWSGKDAFLREHWSKIKNVAEYVLQPIFMNPDVGLVKNTREYWERDANFGVKEGYENAYQLWNIVGLDFASQMASAMNDSLNSTKWRKASLKMKESYLGHPQFSLVDDGRFIKRRLADGGVQRTFEPPNRKAMPPGMPLNVEPVSYCDPDSSSALPIAMEIVDANGALAQKTLKSLEELWNQRWSSGGYARYHVSSEPDSPGPWPFATMFIARAWLEAGNHEKTWRALNWLLDAQGGKAGSWLEYYGDRPTPPLPPVGIVVWTWAELLVFFIHHMLGVRPSPQRMVIRPRLLSGLDRVKGKVFVRGYSVSLDLQRDPKEQWARVDGSRISLKNQILELPLPKKDLAIEIHV
ncbi:MAG: hypothetical protein HYY49_02830, partial [Ignavibacteriales bacterium]|nr:hypothetical protein [Ignavibacteriales bacterium]